ncbi:MAG: hypothetical protein IKA00_01540 [Prevotella sp.]|nr:hypothetical protein [Prevotella sp.]
MNERELLINKFLAGETTIEEEQMLARLIEGEAEYENLQPLLYLLKSKKHSDEELEKWLTEDYSDEYFRLVANRRRTIVRRWLAAASVLLIVGIGALLWFGYEDKANDAVVAVSDSRGGSAYPPSAEVIGESTELLSSRNAVMSQQKAESENKTIASSSRGESANPPVKNPDAPSATLSEEQMAPILAKLRKRSEEIDDSVDRAHIRDYIMNDEKLYNMGQRILCENCPIEE